MTDVLADLWPTTVLKTDVLTPLAILRAQASLLGQKTNGILYAEVSVTESDQGKMLIGLDVIAPALGDYRYRLLSARYTREAVYPVEVIADGLTIQKQKRSGYTDLQT